MQLTCPKCQGAMRQYERSGVHVDQCSECRGIFLDRGELERLIDAESAFHAAPAVSGPPERRSDDRRGDDRHEGRYGDRRYEGDRYGSHGDGHHRKRKSFLSELFD
jgi:Zn-finger nucleic acid-binding protein